MAAQKSPVHFEIQISVNLSDFQQIQVKFHQLFAKVNEVKPWKSLENYQIYRLFDERERKKGRKKLFLAETAKNLQKVPKEKIGKRCSSQPKIFKFYGGRWTPWSNAPVWAPTSHTLADLAKKSQKVPNEKNSPPKKSSKFQKRSKKVEKMILSLMEVVSEWGNREKVVKKEKWEIFLRFQQP